MLSILQNSIKVLRELLMVVLLIRLMVFRKINFPIRIPIVSHNIKETDTCTCNKNNDFQQLKLPSCILFLNIETYASHYSREKNNHVFIVNSGIPFLIVIIDKVKCTNNHKFYSVYLHLIRVHVTSLRQKTVYDKAHNFCLKYPISYL